MTCIAGDTACTGNTQRKYQPKLLMSLIERASNVFRFFLHLGHCTVMCIMTVHTLQ